MNLIVYSSKPTNPQGMLSHTLYAVKFTVFSNFSHLGSSFVDALGLWSHCDYMIMVKPAIPNNRRTGYWILKGCGFVYSTSLIVVTEQNVHSALNYRFQANSSCSVCRPGFKCLVR